MGEEKEGLAEEKDKAKAGRPRLVVRRSTLLVISVIVVAVLLVLSGLLISGLVFPSKTRLILSTTTSTQNSGLLDCILPDFESKYNVNVDVVAVGSGQALDNARNGDADVVLSHAPSLEATFMHQGHGLFRWQVMYNQFAVVGPDADPAGVRHAVTAVDAFTMIANNHSTFLSRADNSGTYTKEVAIWNSAGLNTSDFGTWYKKVGKGMEETLQMAEELDAYTLTDEGTYYSVVQTLTIVELFRNDTSLFNQYSVIPSNPAKNENVNVKYAVLFADWIVSPATQDLIASYKANGHQLFFPNAVPP